MTIVEFDGDEETKSEDDVSKKMTTHGYEGDFQVGDVVRVVPSIHIWSVKEHMKDGFNCQGFVGTVGSLQLYGRKFKTLCSAITPVKIDIMPDSEGVPPGIPQVFSFSCFLCDWRTWKDPSRSYFQSTSP